jgi:hypothetical protein
MTTLKDYPESQTVQISPIEPGWRCAFTEKTDDGFHKGILRIIGVALVEYTYVDSVERRLEFVVFEPGENVPMTMTELESMPTPETEFEVLAPGEEPTLSQMEITAQKKAA